MKKSVFILLAVAFVSLLNITCSSDVNNRIAFRNLSAGGLLVNFRGDAVSVTSGKTVELKDIPKGVYEYNTTYSVPPGTETSTTVGAVSGEVNIKAGTKILTIYSSTFFEGDYTLYATYSSSDSVSTN